MSVFVAAKNIISPLGITAEENFKALLSGETAIKRIDEPEFKEPFYSAKLDRRKIQTRFSDLAKAQSFTFLEQLLILCIDGVLKQNADINLKSNRTVIILSTTKGNIDLLDSDRVSGFDADRKYLWKTGEVVASFFHNPNKTLVVSNACVSGVVAINLGKRLIEAGQYDTALVVGVDLLTPFIVSGFLSFKALSAGVCKPYDKVRDGINLGEACAAMVLKKGEGEIQVLGGSSTNDANHISGPSRTGEGLLLSIQKTLLSSAVKAGDIDFISGHGTATPFNDEMESFAVSRAGLSKVPMNSLKSHFGHTLGAAGVLESVITVMQMKQSMLVKTHNFEQNGVSQPIHIFDKTVSKELKYALKLAAGFGGSNASVLFQKI